MTKEFRKTNMQALKFIYSLSPSYLILIMVNNIFSCVSPYLNIYLTAAIINELSGARRLSVLLVLAAVIVLGNFLISLTNGFIGRAYEHARARFSQNEAKVFINQAFSLDYEKIEDPQVRQLRRKIMESSRINSHGIQSLINSFDILTYNIMNGIFSVIIFIELLFIILQSPFSIMKALLALVIILLIIGSICYNFVFKGRQAKLSNEISMTMIEENRIDDAVDSYNMGKDIRLYRQDYLILQIKEYALNLHKKSFSKFHYQHFWAEMPLLLLNTLLQAAVYLFICSYTLRGFLRAGDIVKYITIVQRFINALTVIFSTVGEIKYNTPFVKDYMDFLNIQSNMISGQLPVSAETHTFMFCGVSFKYPGSDDFVLRDVSCTIRPGSRTAIVGENGSGKTTFVKLICRLYDPTEGEILLDGQNIKMYNYQDYMRILSVVFQDFKLLSFSLGSNIALSSTYSTQRVIDSVEKAGLSSKLQEMPKGIETSLYTDFDEDGFEISGGEAQKIAIARALYKDAPILILDEPTASLDPISEADIYRSLNQNLENKCVLFVSHRLTSCRFCDNILVFQKGRIVQSGSHDALLQDLSGKYYELWNAQAKYYTD